MNHDWHIEAAWKSYRTHVMPPVVGETQYLETRNAFWGGANIMLTLIMDQAAALPDAEAEAMIAGLGNEIVRYAERAVAWSSGTGPAP